MPNFHFAQPTRSTTQLEMNESEFSSQSCCDVVEIRRQRAFHSLALWKMLEKLRMVTTKFC